jgi:uncharacterized protein
MGRRIDSDWKHFRDIIRGALHKRLKHLIKTGEIYRLKGKKYIPVKLPKISIPHFQHGDNDQGVGRGPGKPGDIIRKDDESDQGAGQEEAEGITVNIELDQLLQFMQDELELPDLQPKENDIFQDVDIKYNGIALTGPESLRHNGRTWREALKRITASGDADKLYEIPGFAMPVKLITPINRDKRYRMYREIRIPSNNAVIFFARDGSGSMDEFKCGIVSDMAWWIDKWIRRFHDKVERCYVWHDTVAQEVDEEKFYNYRYGGGTTCSSALKYIAKQFENRFPPNAWNIYVFYFGDGENWNDDNETYWQTLVNEFPPHICNMFAITQVCCWHYSSSLKKFIDDKTENIAVPNLRTVSIGPEETPDFSSGWNPTTLSDDERDVEIKRAIKEILGAKK